MGKIGFCLLTTLVLLSPLFSEIKDEDIDRSGFHLQIAFGYGIGPTSNGLLHNMELGYTRDDGITFGLQHTFVQSKGFAKSDGDEDLVGGWMFQLKYPLSKRVVPKAALGLGGIHVQDDGIEAESGLGLSYGIDYHFPMGPSHGFTLTAQAMHAYVFNQEKGHFWLGVGAGYTFF